MQLTYAEARDTVLETTEMGYTVASQDKLWTVFTFDLDSENEYRFNRLFFITPNCTSYEMFHDELMWTSREEAEEFARLMRINQMEFYREWLLEGNEPFALPDIYVINWGDDSRYEATILDLPYRRTRKTPKYKGSIRAWSAMADMRRRWWEARP